MTIVTTNLETHVQSDIDALTGAEAPKDILKVAVEAKGLSVNIANLEAAINTAISATTGATSESDLLALNAARIAVEGGGYSLEIGDRISTENAVLPNGKRLVPVDTELVDSVEYPLLAAKIASSLKVKDTFARSVTAIARAIGTSRDGGLLYAYSDEGGASLQLTEIDPASRNNVTLRTMTNSNEFTVNNGQLLMTSDDGQIIHFAFYNNTRLYMGRSLDGGATFEADVQITTSVLPSDHVAIWCGPDGVTVKVALNYLNSTTYFESVDSGASFTQQFSATSSFASGHIRWSNDGRFLHCTAQNNYVTIDTSDDSEVLGNPSTSAFLNNCFVYRSLAGNLYATSSNAGAKGGGAFQGVKGSILYGKVTGSNIEPTLINIPERYDIDTNYIAHSTVDKTIASEILDDVFYWMVTPAYDQTKTSDEGLSLLFIMDLAKGEMLGIEQLPAPELDKSVARLEVRKSSDGKADILTYDQGNNAGVGRLIIEYDKFLTLPNHISVASQDKVRRSGLKIVADPA